MSALEIARATCQPGKGDELQESLLKAIELLVAEKQTTNIELYRGIENPNEFTLLVTWTSVGAHEAWRASDARERYRALLVDALAPPIRMDHHLLIAKRKGTAADAASSTPKR